jgi:hypothetical protein
MSHCVAGTELEARRARRPVPAGTSSAFVSVRASLVLEFQVGERLGARPGGPSYQYWYRDCGIMAWLDPRPWPRLQAGPDSSPTQPRSLCPLRCILGRKLARAGKIMSKAGLNVLGVVRKWPRAKWQLGGSTAASGQTFGHCATMMSLLTDGFPVVNVSLLLS